MAYILRREDKYSDAEREHVVATLLGSGYDSCKADSSKEVFTRESSTITLGKKVLQLSFSSDEGNDREHLHLLLGLQAIVGVSEIGVDNRVDLRHLSAAGFKTHLIS